jgi:SAM-dependent methyltransferase
VTSKTYDEIGTGYAKTRRADARHEHAILDALGGARTVVNVGAGTGSYEPRELLVVAVEPSATMITQRPPASAPVAQASAEALPFADSAFEGGLAVLTVHHWLDKTAGLRELRRVVTGPVVVFTADIEVWSQMWLVRDYLPEIGELDRRRFPSPERIAEDLGGARIEPLLTPADCTDGFTPAFWRRPWAYLDPAVRQAQSGFATLGEETVAPGLAALDDDLRSGAWHERNRASSSSRTTMRDTVS